MLENAISQNLIFAGEKPLKWNLTATAFDKLLVSLDHNDRRRAGEKYLLLRGNLVRFFEGRRISEAEEAADEVCNRLARKLETGTHIENVNQYAYGVARLLVLELCKERQRQQQALEELRRNEISQDELEEDENQQRLACLNQCLKDLSADNRELILTYYSGEGREKIKNRGHLAEKLCIRPNALRSRAVRLREKLKISLYRNLKKQTI